MYPQIFFSTQKRTNRSLAKTNKACIDLKNFPQIFQNLWWYLVVFGSISMLLGILLIKNSTFKMFFSYQIDINKILNIYIQKGRRRRIDG